MEKTNTSTRLRRIYWIKLLSFLGILALIFIALVTIKNLLFAFVLAIIFSYVITPFVSKLETMGINRALSILVVYCIFSIFAGLLIWSVSPFIATQFRALNVRIPEYVDGTVRLFDKLRIAIDLHAGGVFNSDPSERIRTWLTNQSSLLFTGLPSALSSSASVLFLSPIFSFFILKDGRLFTRNLLQLAPNSIYELAISVQYQINQQIAHYIRARILESLIVGGVCVIGFWIMGFPYAFLLAVAAALANLIPYVGPLFGAAPGIILALINNSPPLTIILVLLVYILAQLIDNVLVIPLVVARIVNLHPITVILVVLLGAQILGVLGMLISIPVASTIKVTLKSVYDHLTDSA